MEKKLETDQKAISSHYDLPPEFFASFLGPQMAYSCAYFIDENEELASAENNKLKLTSEKLELRKNDKLLDIGSGWGSMLFYAAQNYGCVSTGITLANEQVAYVNKKAKKLNLPVSSKIMHSYNMDFDEKYFDKIVTIGAIEHMKDLRRVFRGAYKIMKDDGLFLVHGMTLPWSRRKDEINGVYSEAGELVKKHFGIGYWHSLFEVIESLEKEGFEVLDVENITRHYQYTIERWLENLEKKEDEIAGKIIPEDKYREFVAFMASYIVGFEFGSPLCQQILCQKTIPGELRPVRPFLRTTWNNNE